MNDIVESVWFFICVEEYALITLQGMAYNTITTRVERRLVGCSGRLDFYFIVQMTQNEVN